MAALRAAALYCEFRDLEDILLDQLICGVRDIRLQCLLLAKTDVRLQSALDEARASELSNKSATEIRKNLNPLDIQKAATVHQDEVNSDHTSEDEEDVRHLKIIQKKGWATEGKKAQAPCIDCRGNHHRSACRFKNADCRQCGGKRPPRKGL